MYAVAARLDPDTYLDLARATYREMVSAGITSVGEFHYLHHGPDGTPYDDPNAMGARARRGGAARQACASRCWTPATSPQGSAALPRACRCRFSDGIGGGVGGARRARCPCPTRRADAVRVGAAIHSVRAVPREEMKHGRRAGPTHVGRRCTCTCPSRSRRTTRASPRTASHRPRCSPRPAPWASGPRAVHATHLTDGDIALLGRLRHPRLLLPDDRAGPR